MSFLRNNFSTKKAPPRKPVRHRNPLNLTGPEIEAELGENFHGVNLKIGDKKIGYNSEQAKWELRKPILTFEKIVILLISYVNVFQVLWMA